MEKQTTVFCVCVLLTNKRNSHKDIGTEECALMNMLFDISVCRDWDRSTCVEENDVWCNCMQRTCNHLTANINSLSDVKTTMTYKHRVAHAQKTCCLTYWMHMKKGFLLSSSVSVDEARPCSSCTLFASVMSQSFGNAPACFISRTKMSGLTPELYNGARLPTWYKTWATPGKNENKQEERRSKWEVVTLCASVDWKIHLVYMYKQACLKM